MGVSPPVKIFDNVRFSVHFTIANSEVNKAVFISKNRTESDEDSDDVSSLVSPSCTLKQDAGGFSDDCNSETSSSTMVAQILSKSRERDSKAFDKWLKAKVETERIRKEKEQKRKRREEAIKKLEEERRKQESEEKLKKWVERKELERKKKQEIQEKQKQKKELEQKLSKNWTNSDDSTTNFNAWLSRVKQQKEETKLRQLAKQRIEEEIKQQRQDLSRMFYGEWLKSAKDKPKPVPLNRGIESLRGTVSKIFINPNPWQATD
ncbi:coiled-coil domain-containing protein 34-like [Sabethes cyaneus]|uniref:coiled-coil domain-containing protein 34-like n=1 Tax=Sabethes cyaneus TaxID=53552 RepID=UPI00237EB2A2|nr:coiled-coil domain-containing protein 34-like [Sabethes cyaneus]